MMLRTTDSPSVRDATPSLIGPQPASSDAPPEHSRRQFLRALGAGSATVVVAGVAAGGYRVFDTAALNPSSGRAYDPWLHWRETPGPLGAVAAAILAANPHNTQPWRFHVTGTAIDVFVDGPRNTGAVDPYLREQHIGLGCAVENLVLACQARGLEPTVQLMPDGTGTARVAHVALAAARAQANPLYDEIGRRHTNRGPYDGRPVPDQIRTELVDTAGLPGVSVHWLAEPSRMAELGRLMVDAAVALTGDGQQSRDSFAWFRSDNDLIQRHRDGLILDAQGLSPLMLSVAKLLPASSRSAGDRFWVNQTRDVHTKTAAAYGVITAADPDDRETQLVAGRLLQRIHLTATRRGVALQHMNQITERIDAERMRGAPATFEPRFAALLPAAARPLVAFRVGYASRRARSSPRRSVDAVTT